MGCSRWKEAEQRYECWPEVTKNAVKTSYKLVIWLGQEYFVEFWSSHHIQATAEITLKVEEAAVVRETIIFHTKRPDLWNHVTYCSAELAVGPAVREQVQTWCWLLNLVPQGEVGTSPSPNHPDLQQVLSVCCSSSVSRSQSVAEKTLTPSVFWLLSCRVCLRKLFYHGRKSRKYSFISPMRTLMLTIIFWLQKLEI